MNRKETLVISITIFLTVIAWVTADVLHAKAQEQIKNKVVLPSIKKYNIDQNVFTILQAHTE